MKEETIQRVRRPFRRGFDSAEQETYLSLWRTYDRLRLLEDQLFAGFELTAQQYNVLRLLQAEAPEAVPTLGLAERLVSRAPDITRMLDRLEERGWIERNRSAADRRNVWVRITPAGEALLGEIAAPLRECHEKQLGHLAVAELKSLASLLQKARAPHESEQSPWR